MSEKRRFQRYNITVSVSYMNTDDTKTTDAQSKNISSSGICLSSIQPMKLKSTVKLTFSMESQTIHVLGRVIWSEQVLPRLFDNGIEFLSMSEEHLKVIEKYIKTQ
ncbi:MAG: PilZ domain-containing protein [Spirochaetales bacterium]|nr:PilZ domain-containing protein [Spirochaetales bacterium]